MHPPRLGRRHSPIAGSCKTTQQIPGAARLEEYEQRVDSFRRPPRPLGRPNEPPGYPVRHAPSALVLLGASPHDRTRGCARSRAGDLRQSSPVPCFDSGRRVARGSLARQDSDQYQARPMAQSGRPPATRFGTPPRRRTRERTGRSPVGQSRRVACARRIDAAPPSRRGNARARGPACLRDCIDARDCVRHRSMASGHGQTRSCPHTRTRIRRNR